MHQQTVAHWSAIKRVILYLKGTSPMDPHSQITFPSFACFSNVDWAGDHINNQTFTSACLVFLVAPDQLELPRRKS